MVVSHLCSSSCANELSSSIAAAAFNLNCATEPAKKWPLSLSFQNLFVQLLVVIWTRSGGGGGHCGGWNKLSPLAMERANEFQETQEGGGGSLLKRQLRGPLWPTFTMVDSIHFVFASGCQLEMSLNCDSNQLGSFLCLRLVIASNLFRKVCCRLFVRVFDLAASPFLVQVAHKINKQFELANGGNERAQ